MSNNPYPDFDNDDDSGAPLRHVEPPAPLIGDRGEPQTKSPKKKKRGVILAVVVIILFAIMAIGLFGMTAYRALHKNKAEAAALVEDDAALAQRSSQGPDLGAYQSRVAKQLEEDQKKAEADKAIAAASGAQQPPAAAAAAPSLGQYQGQAQGQAPVAGQQRQTRNGKPIPTPQEVAAARRWQEDVLWEEKKKSGSSRSNGAPQQTRQTSDGTTTESMTFEERMAANPYASGAAGAGAGAGGSNSGGSLSGGNSSAGSSSIGGMLATESYPDGFAFIRQDLKFLLIHGTTIPCTLLPRIVTNYPGQTSCLINRDVYSADGSVVLIGRGSKVDGERKVSMKAGIAKVFVSWGSIETPDGVRVRIDSMAADQLGGAGLDAWIDNHYAERFGGAILLSFLDDAFQAIADQAAGNSEDGGMTFDSSTNNAQDMASIALENSINIPPTGYVQHATETNIIVARDIDFRTVYGVK